jgi:hypothetical protein
MEIPTGPPQRFSNHRDWRGYVSAVHCSVTYAKAIHELRAGGAWYAGAPAQASLLPSAIPP